MKSRPLLFNPFWAMAGRGGSYYRTPRWRCYDQILLSRGLLNSKSPFQYIQKSEKIFSDKEIIELDDKPYKINNFNGKPIPYDHDINRGCSDHFAVFISVGLK
jgi:hypothetical protein